MNKVRVEILQGINALRLPTALKKQFEALTELYAEEWIAQRAKELDARGMSKEPASQQLRDEFKQEIHANDFKVLLFEGNQLMGFLSGTDTTAMKIKLRKQFEYMTQNREQMTPYVRQVFSRMKRFMGSSLVLGNVFVVPHARKKKYAKQLFDAAHDFAVGKGIEKLVYDGVSPAIERVLKDKKVRFQTADRLFPDGQRFPITTGELDLTLSPREPELSRVDKVRARWQSGATVSKNWKTFFEEGEKGIPPVKKKKIRKPRRG